jgi:hypothetical protein
MEAVKIPIELYAILGVLIASNVGTIGAFMKSVIKRETEIALIHHNLTAIQKQLEDIKSFQEKATRDIHEAHTKIREIKVLYDHGA